MRLVIVFTLLLCLAVSGNGYAQEKTKKEIKKEKQFEQLQQTGVLLNSKTFQFIAQKALPTGMKTMYLSLNGNFLKVNPDLIECDMPFFGRVYGTVSNLNEGGLKFKGQPENFKIIKEKKEFKVICEVKGTGDSYNLSLLVYYDSSATLTITSNNRSVISYQGDIFPLTEINKQ